MEKAVLLFLTVIAFCGCENDNDPRSRAFDPSYFPLEVGNNWEYIPISQAGDLLSVNVEIPSTATIDDHEYYLMVTRYVYTGVTNIGDSSYYRINSSGYVFVRTTSGLEEANRFRLAAAEGETWTIEAPPFKDFVATAGGTSPVDINTITIENCKSYVFDLPRFIDDEHSLILAPRLGIIRKFFGEGANLVLKQATIGGVEYNF